MNKKQFTCIVCPIGCKILVETDGKKLKILEGNKCKKGIEYARMEALDPRRNLTSSIMVENGRWPLVSVKTTKPVPKDKIFDVLKEIKQKKINAPVELGQKLMKNVANTGIDVVATKNIEKR